MIKIANSSSFILAILSLVQPGIAADMPPSSYQETDVSIHHILAADPEYQALQKQSQEIHKKLVERADQIRAATTEALTTPITTVPSSTEASSTTTVIPERFKELANAIKKKIYEREYEKQLQESHTLPRKECANMSDAEYQTYVAKVKESCHIIATSIAEEKFNIIWSTS